MDYTVSDTKLQDLNVIVGEKGGTIPSEVSEALRKAQIAHAAGAPLALTKALDEAIAANIKNGAAWSDVQTWHDSVKATGVPPELPPVEIPGMPPAGTIVKKPARFKVPVTETPNHIQVEGPCRPSIAVADGKQVTFGYAANPDEFVEGQASSGNGTAMAQVPAGIWWMSWKLSPGMGGSTPGDISVY